MLNVVQYQQERFIAHIIEQLRLRLDWAIKCQAERHGDRRDGGAGIVCSVGYSAGGGTLAKRSVRRSPRATCRNSGRSSSAIASTSASSSAIWREGRRSSVSILRMVATEQPTCSARASWVK